MIATKSFTRINSLKRLRGRSRSKVVQQKKAWHEVLGVAPSASSDEIRDAYKRKMSQYHPDKVASLGEEFMEIAVNKSKEINVAYKQGMALRA